MKIFTTIELLRAMNKKGYAVFNNGNPFNLNIVGVRANNPSPDNFDDTIYCFYSNYGWIKFAWPVTTDPGLFYLQNPLNVDGTAILAPGQYRGAFKIGLHHGQYEALVQAKPVRVIRDTNRDNKLDFGSENIVEGMFGINIHRASIKHESIQVDKWSAGCQVFANPDHFKTFIELCKNSKELYGNRFTYTLLNEKDI